MALDGLTEHEAARRLAERPPPRAVATSRSYRSIVVANVFTVLNAILAVAGAVTLALGDWQDALFLGILVANTAIGIGQEARAKRALDRLAALIAPTATVVRDGASRRLHVDEAFGFSTIDARTVATSVLVYVGLYLVWLLERASSLHPRLLGALCGILGIGYAGMLVLPPTRRFFALSAPEPAIVALSVAAIALGSALARVGARRAAS